MRALAQVFGAACVMNQEEGNGADAATKVQAAIDAARHARMDKHPSFRRLLQALAKSVGSQAELAQRMELSTSSRLSDYINDRSAHGKALSLKQRDHFLKDFSAASALPLYFPAKARTAAR